MVWRVGGSFMNAKPLDEADGLWGEWYNAGRRTALVLLKIKIIFAFLNALGRWYWRAMTVVAEVENGLIPSLVDQTQRVLGLLNVTEATSNVVFFCLCGVELGSVYNTKMVFVELFNQATEINV